METGGLMGGGEKGSLLLDLPVRLSRQDYCNAAVLYQKKHGSAAGKKAVVCLVAVAFSILIGCMAFAALAGGGDAALQLFFILVFFSLILGGGWVLERFLLYHRASGDYASSELLRQESAVRFYQNGVVSLSPTGRHLFLWEELDGALEKEWGLLLYRKDKIIALPGRVLDQGSAEYLHGLLSVKMGKKYRIEDFVIPTGPFVCPPAEENEGPEHAPEPVFLEICALQNSYGWRKKQKRRWLATAVLCSGCFGVFCLALFSVFHPFSTGVLAGITGFGVCFVAFLAVLLQMGRKNGSEMEQPVTFRFAAEGLEYEQGREKTFIPWRLVNRIQAKPDGYLVEYDGYCSLFIEKQTLYHPEGSESSEVLAGKIESIFNRCAPPAKGR